MYGPLVARPRTSSAFRLELRSLVRARVFSKRNQRGQGLVEFALILPIMVSLVGVSIDIARLYFAWIDVESATRHAAQWIATDPGYETTGGYYDDSDSANYCGQPGVATGFPCTEAPGTDAKTVLDRELKFAFTKVTDVPTCATVTVPTVYAVIQESPSTLNADGGSAAYPVATAKVITCLPFRSFFSYPLLTHDGVWPIAIERTFTIVVGR
jgi:Flp pilus assembly protein TadG